MPCRSSSTILSSSNKAGLLMLSRNETNVQTLLLLHLAVFLAGWTGIFGRLIALGGLPLVWYRIFVSIVTLAYAVFTVNLAYNLEPVYSIAFAALLFGELRELGWSFWLGLGLIVVSVLIQTMRVRRRAGLSG